MSSAKFTIVLVTLIVVVVVFSFLLPNQHQSIIEKSPEAIYLMAREAVVNIKMDFSYDELEGETGKNKTVYGQGNFTGTIVNYSGYSEAFILSAGHLFSGLKGVTWNNCSFTAFFKNPQAPEKIILCGVDEPYLKGGLDFSVFKFKNSKVAKRFEKIALQLGSSSELKIGEPIFIVGHFLDTPFIFTQGHVTYLNLYNQYLYRPQTIMTDAIFNFGSSGGPLLNRMGKLVGVNVALTPNNPSDGSAKMYLSVPIDDIKRVLLIFAKYNPDAVISGPIFIRHPIPQQIILVNSWEQSDKELSMIGLKKRSSPEGVFVAGFPFPFVPASDALQLGDRIVICNSQIVKDKIDVYREIFFSFNQKMEVTLERDDKLMNVVIDLLFYE